MGCGSSLTGCGRLAGPQLPCPPHGEHAFIGVRQYRARPFFASAAPAPCPAAWTCRNPMPSQHDPDQPATLAPQRHIADDQLARCSHSMIATTSPRSSASEPSARGMTPSASPALLSLGAPVAFPNGLAQVPGELTSRMVDRLNNRHGGVGRSRRRWRHHSPACRSLPALPPTEYPPNEAH